MDPTEGGSPHPVRTLLHCRFRHRLLAILFLCSLLTHTARANDDSESTSQLISNSTTTRFSRKSDINIFYDSLNLCKKHHIVERDTREEDSRPWRRKDKDRSSEREVKKIKTQDMVEEEDDDKDIDPEQNDPARQQCNLCRKSRDALRNESLEFIKGDILNRLGMSHPPNFTGKHKPLVGQFVLHRLMEKFEADKHDIHHYTPRRHGHHSSLPSVQWFNNDDESAQMQGDAPPESDSVSVKDSGDRSSSNVRSHLNSSDNRYSDKNSFQEGEVYIEEDDDYHVRTMKVVSFSLPHPKLRHIQPDVQYFSFSEKARANKVKRVLLWVYILGKDWSKSIGNTVEINVYKLYRSGQQGGKNNDSPILLPVITRLTQQIPSGAGAWLCLEYAELEKTVSEWFRSPLQNTGLIINATDKQGSNLAVTSHQSTENSVKLPFLEVYVTDMKKHRTKRTLGLNCNESSNETRCCRYPLIVDFEEFGWDWIIAPKKYEANFCDGECPMMFLPGYSHTHLAQVANLPRSKTACCAPRKLSAISMLYFSPDGTVMYVTLPSMVVDRCGCS